MSIVIRVVGDWQTNGSLNTRKNDLENQSLVLDKEIDGLDRVIDNLANCDIVDTKEELEDVNISDSSLSEKLDGLNSVKAALLHNLAEVRNDLETRLRGCQSRLRELLSENESTEEDSLWTISDCREGQQQDTMWRL